MKQCEMCGKELKASEAFTRHGKTLCHDCASSKICASCGRKIKGSDVCYIGQNDKCYDCMFKYGKEEYELFLQSLKNYNNEKKAEHNITERKRRLKVLLFGLIALAVAILVVLLIFWLINRIDPSISSRGRTYRAGGSGGIIGSVILTTLILLRKKPYTEVEKTEYYNKYWKK